MPLSDLIPIDPDMISEISRRVGNQAELEGAGGVIERAINDAILSVVLTWRHTEFEETPPHFFKSEAILGTDATNVAQTDTVTTSDLEIFNKGQRILDSVWQFGSGTEGLLQTVVGAINNSGDDVRIWTVADPPYTLTLAPQSRSDHTNEDYILVIRRYPLPLHPGTGKPAFFIYDLSDTTNNIPIRSIDVRMVDRSVPIAGQAIYYDRLQNEIYLHPAPFHINSVTPDGGASFRLRYGFRPAYKAGTDTIDPLPEEWQEMIMLEATAKVWDLEKEFQRGAAARQEAQRLAAIIMKPFSEELDDVVVAFIPVKHRW